MLTGRIELSAPEYVRVEVASAITAATLGHQPRLSLAQAYAAVSEFLAVPITTHDSAALLTDAMVLVHQPTRIRTLNDEIEIMPLPDWIELHERMAGYLKPAPVVGVAINGYDLDEAAAREWAERITGETGLPAVDPVKFGAEPLVEAVLAAPTGKARPSAAARGVAR